MTVYNFESLSLKNAIKEGKVVFDDELVRIASNPHASINEAIFEVEFSNFLSGNAHPIYLDPVQFFKKTHFSDYMKTILMRVLSRVASISDESYAIILDTTFGGGKTHTLVMLYHVFKNRDVALNSQEIRQILKELGLETIPEVKIVAIDGHNVDPETNLWNVIGKELGDVSITSKTLPPTAKEIENAIRRIGKPVIFLLDELVVYFSKIMGEKEGNGRIAQNKGFIHSLFVATEATKTSIVVLTIPESEAYQKEAQILRDITAIAERGAIRIEPVSKEDIIRILKKRFIKHIDENFARKVAKALHELYVAKLGVADAYREERLAECYPFHPELIEEIFFGRIGTYENFQRTRGILKIMARVIVNLLRHVDELPETSLFISAGEVDLSDSELRSKLTAEIFGKKLDQVVQTDIATSEGTAHAQQADGGKIRFGNFVRIATTVYLYSLFPDETKRGANGRMVFRALGDANLDPSTIDAYLERLYDEITTHLFRAEGTDRYFFKTEVNPRALVRIAARDVKDEEVKLHLQKEFISKIIPSTETIAVNIFDKEIKKDNTDPNRLNIFVIDYEDVFNYYRAIKSTKEYESVSEDVVRREVYSRIFSQMLSITTPNRNSVILLFPIPSEIPSFRDTVKELIACEKLKKERSKDKEFIKELRDIQKKIYAKAAQKLINLYSYAGFYKKNDQEVKPISPITYDDKAKYSERIFEDLEKKYGKVISTASIDYVEGVMGLEKDYVKFSDLIQTTANSTSYPFIPAKLLKASLKELVKTGDIAIFRGEICEPEEVDLEKSDEILKNLKMGVEVAEVRSSDYILKKDFAEKLLEVAKKKRADLIAEKIIKVLGDKNYEEFSKIDSQLLEYSRKDIIDAAKRSDKLELFAGDISSIQKLESGVELENDEAKAVLDAFGSEGEVTYIFRREYADEIKDKLRRVKPPVVTPSPQPPKPKETLVSSDDILEKFEDFSGRSVTLIKVSGKGSDNLKEDSLSISGAVPFLNLSGTIKVEVEGKNVTTFKCEVELAKVGVVDEILQKIASLDENPEYTFELELENPVKIDEDFKLFVEQLATTKSQKWFRVT